MACAPFGPGHLELHVLVLLEAAEAVAVNLGVVHEDIRPISAGDEAVALLRLEPLDGSLCPSLLTGAGYGSARCGPDATLLRSLKRHARNTVLRELAGDTNTQGNYKHLAQPIRCPVHFPPARGCKASFQRPAAICTPKSDSLSQRARQSSLKQYANMPISDILISGISCMSGHLQGPAGDRIRSACSARLRWYPPRLRRAPRPGPPRARCELGR
jgi:hypothetical protein